MLLPPPYARSVAINQHGDTNAAQNKADVRAFTSVLKQCSAGTIVVVDMARCNPATRSWCIYGERGVRGEGRQCSAGTLAVVPSWRLDEETRELMMMRRLMYSGELHS